MKLIRFGILSLALLVPVVASGADKNKIRADKEALEEIQGYIGAWKGVGRPKRNSPKGSWSVESSWSWKFNDKGAVLAFTSAKGKYFKSGEIAPGKKAGTFVLTAVPTRGKKNEIYTGSVDKKKKGLVLVAKKAKAGRPAKLTLRVVAGGDRLIVLYERKLGSIYTRLGEVGFTRKGGSFGKGASGPECIVTGGKGTIAVSYGGKTYYVCCSGCKDLFDEDPKGVLADWEKAKKKKKNKKDDDDDDDDD